MCLCRFCAAFSRETENLLEGKGDHYKYIISYHLCYFPRRCHYFHVLLYLNGQLMNDTIVSLD